jgi:hypothetical protein
VLWSRHSVQSDWVHIEADEAKRRRILVPALIDDVQIPLAFRRIQTANLVDWAEGSPRAGFDELVSAVSEVLSSSSHDEPTHTTDVVTAAMAADPAPPDGCERIRLPETKTATTRTAGWGYATRKEMILLSVPILALIGIAAYTYTHRARTMASPSKREPSQFKPEAADPLSASGPRHPSPPEPSAEPRTNERSKRTSVSPPEDTGPARPPEKLPSLPAGTVRVNPKDELSNVWIVAGEFVMGCSPDDDLLLRPANTAARARQWGDNARNPTLKCRDCLS